MTPKPEGFGCEKCWPPGAEAAWDAMLSLKTNAALVDESHFMIKLRACPACGQHFVSVFTETVDWADGEDPQCWILMPVTPNESRTLADIDMGLIDRLMTLAPQRRSLCHDHPKGRPPKSSWSRGVVIGPHD